MCPSLHFHFTIYSFQTSPILNFIRKTVVEYLLIPEPPKCVAFAVPMNERLPPPSELSSLRYT